jgi:hypothetical protein
MTGDIREAAAGVGEADVKEGKGVWVPVVVLSPSMKRKGWLVVWHRPKWAGAKGRKFYRAARLVKRPIRWRGLTQAWVGAAQYRKLFGAPPALLTPALRPASIVFPTMPLQAGGSAPRRTATPVAPLRGTKADGRAAPEELAKFRGGIFKDHVFSQKLFD